MKSIWSTLGIRATNDRAEIRRAYSRKLKVVHPEDDAEGFQVLRAAYDQALRQAAFAEQRLAYAEADEFGGDDFAPRPPEPLVFEPGDAAPAGDMVMGVDGRDGADDPDPAEPLQALDLVGRADEEAHRAACDRLQALLSEGAEHETVLKAFYAVLASPALDSVAIRDWTEGWLAWLIVQNAPRGDMLVGAAIGYFGWRDDQVGAASELGAPVLQRQRDLEFLRAVTRSGHPNHAAFMALKEKPIGWRLWRNRTWVRLPRQVRRLLDAIQWERPGLMAALDANAIGWWRAYFAKPQFAPVNLWVSLAVPLGTAWLLWPFFADLKATTVPDEVSNSELIGLLVAYLVNVAGLFAIQLAYIYAVARPRAAWREEAIWRAPLWVRLGWAPAALTVLIVAALAPSSGWWFIGLGVPAAGAALWAHFTADPDQSAADGLPWARPRWVSVITMAFFAVIPLLQPRTQIPWRLRAATTYGYLVIFWLIAEPDMPVGSWLQMSAPLLGAAAAFALGGETLAETWRELKVSRRRWILLAAIAVTAATPLFLWSVAPSGALAPAAAALVAVLTLLHKAVVTELDDGFAYGRDLAMRYGWLIWLTIAGAMADPGRQGQAGLLFGGLWLLTGVGVGLLGALRKDRWVKA